MTINVVPANLQSIEQLGNTVYVSTANTGVGTQCVKIPKSSGQLFSDQQPITNGQGNVYVWNLSVPPNAVINTPNSYLRYKVKMCMKSLTYNNTAQGAAGAITNYGDLTKTHGRYFVKDNMLWFQCALFKNDNTFLGFGPVVCKNCFPMNSTVILNTTEVIYGNVKQTDEAVFQQRTLYQSQIAEEYQAMHSRQWFEQDTDMIFDICTCGYNYDTGTYSNQINTTGTYTFYQTFTIAMNLINQIFDLGNQFYSSSLTRQMVQMSIKLQPYTMAKLFWTETALDAALTGITEMDLFIYCKESEQIKSQLQSKNAATFLYQKYEVDNITLTNGGDGKTTAYLSRGHTSSNEVVLGLSLYDVGAEDSTYLKQRFTLFDAKQQVAFYNNDNGLLCPFDEEFAFFSDLNIERGSSAKRFFSDALFDPYMMRHETLRSTNALQQMNSSDSQSFNTIMRQMMKYALIRIDLQAFSMDNQVDDVAYDGYHSTFQRLLVTFQLAHHNLTKGTLTKMTDDANHANIKIAVSSSLNVFAYQMFDQCVQINPSTGMLTISEDIK